MWEPQLMKSDIILQQIHIMVCAEQNGTVTMYHYRTTTLNLQQILNYSHNFGKHNISVMLGHESYKYNYAELSASKKKYVFILGKP